MTTSRPTFATSAAARLANPTLTDIETLREGDVLSVFNLRQTRRGITFTATQVEVATVGTDEQGPYFRARRVGTGIGRGGSIHYREYLANSLMRRVD